MVDGGLLHGGGYLADIVAFCQQGEQGKHRYAILLTSQSLSNGFPMLHFPKPNGFAVVLFSSVLLLAACGKPEPVEAPVRAVKVLTVGQSDMSMEFEFSGEVRARVETALGFRVNGKLLQRPAEIGQRVKAGQLLAELDPMDYRLAAVASSAQLASAQTTGT